MAPSRKSTAVAARFTCSKASGEKLSPCSRSNLGGVGFDLRGAGSIARAWVFQPAPRIAEGDFEKATFVTRPECQSLVADLDSEFGGGRWDIASQTAFPDFGRAVTKPWYVRRTHCEIVEGIGRDCCSHQPTPNVDIGRSQPPSFTILTGTQNGSSRRRSSNCSMLHISFVTPAAIAGVTRVVW